MGNSARLCAPLARGDRVPLRGQGAHDHPIRVGVRLRQGRDNAGQRGPRLGVAALRSIEVGETDASLRRPRHRGDLRLKLALRIGGLSGAGQTIRQARVQVVDDGIRLGALGVDRAAERGDGIRTSSLALRDDAEDEVAHVTRRIGLDAATRERCRVAEAARIHHQLRQDLVGRRRIAARRQFRVLARARWLTVERVDPRQREVGLGLQWFDREHLAERLDRVLGAAEPDQALRGEFPRVEHLRFLRQQWFECGDDLAIASVRRIALRAAQRFVSRDLVFRIRERRACCRRRRRRGRVAEGAQPLPRVGVGGRRRCDRRSARRAIQPAAQRRRDGGFPGRDVVALGGIRGHVVQLGPRRPDVVIAAVDGRREIAPAEVQPRIQRFRKDGAIRGTA